jgi:hypothetical protein
VEVAFDRVGSIFVRFRAFLVMVLSLFLSYDHVPLGCG